MALENESSQLEQSAELSHLNVHVICPNNRLVKINAVSVNETSAFLKQTVSETIETAFYTHYSFEKRDSEGDEFIRLNDNVVSYTIAD